jgi:ergothioneine biosynthesis protein EgtB
MALGSVRMSAIPSANLRTLYRTIRATSLRLCEPLAIEDHVVQSMPDASPAKWNLAHTTWFFETFVLGPFVPGYRVFDPRYALLFNSYYHAAGERHPRPQRGLLSRPTVAEVRAYREHVDAAMECFLDGERALEGRPAFVVELGLNHEEQHQELLLTDLKHMFATNPIEPAYRSEAPPSSPQPGAAGWSAFDGGLGDLGTDDPAFAFDNERPRHRTWIDPFELADRPVTAGEYLEFIEDGGYERSELWLSDGWDEAVRRSWTAPLYWKRGGEDWREVTLHGPRPLDRAAPVCHVSFYEADAYARWKGARLPSEAEWEHVAAALPVEGNLLESDRLHPVAAPGSGPRQLFGDVWEWTSSAYLPYPGFAPFPGGIGEYNGKWMSNRMVLRGGSCVTPRRHLRASYRNFFDPQARWQFSGIRLARSPA